MLARKRGRWPALVEDETWAKVQERIEGHRRMPHQARGEYLLSGLLRCPRCGGRMSGWNRLRQQAHYRCNGMREVKCSYAAPSAAIDAAVLTQATALLAALETDDDGLQVALKRAWDRLARPSGDADRRKRMEVLERDIERGRKRMTSATMKLVDDLITKAAYDELTAQVQADLERSETELARLRAERPGPTLPPLDVVLRDVGGWAAALRDADVPARREVIGLLIERVIPERLGWRSYSARVEWSPLGLALRQLLDATGAAA